MENKTETLKLGQYYITEGPDLRNNILRWKKKLFTQTVSFLTQIKDNKNKHMESHKEAANLSSKQTQFLRGGVT